ncbi:MAG: class I SAM-dependent methyltransferase [Terriglobales bacterium]
MPDITLSWRKADSFPGNFSSPTTIQERPCPICGSIRYRTFLRFDQFQFYSDSAELPKRADVRHVQCLDCFTLYQNPSYSDYGFRTLFAEAGRSYGAAPGRVEEQVEWLSAKGLLERGIRCLDAGCFDGMLLAAMPANIQRVGVDIDKPAIDRGQRLHGHQGIQFICGNFENFHNHARLDTITMFHVLEHLPKPVAVLQNLRTMAHSDTHLVVEVPLLENGVTNDLNGFFSFYHMTHFSRTSLQNCLALGGWKVCDAHQLGYNGFRVVALPAECDSKPQRDLKCPGLLANYFASWFSSVKNAEVRASNLDNARRCVIWGGGTHTEFLYHLTSFFHAFPDREYIIVDSDPMKQGKTWRGLCIYAPTVLRNFPWSDDRLLVSSYGGQLGIVQAAVDLGVPNEKIVSLYDSVQAY